MGGWTILELMAAVTVVGVLSAIAITSFASLMGGAKTQRAEADLATIHAEIERYALRHNGELPDSLEQIGMALIDPWGEPYQYLNFDSLPGKSKGPIRKDHNLVPLNSRFDLYSKGPDKRSSPPLTAKASRDDIIVANDGEFIGRASDY